MTDVRWGFLGAGWLASTATAAACHAADGARLEVAGARSWARASALDPQRAYGSYDEVLADPAVEAVYINLANDAHLPWILAAVESGRHVLCEKPMTLTAADAETAFAAAEAAGVLLVEAVWSRWHPRIQRIVSLASSGELGDLTSYLGTFTFTGDLEGNYRLSASTGGGALYDVGIYPLHVLSACLGGAEHLRPVAVEVDLGAEVDLTTRVTVEWSTGQGSVVASFVMPDSQRLDLRGSLGSVRVADDQAFTSWRTPSELIIGEQREMFPAVDAYQLLFEQVSARIRGEEAWVVPPRDSIEVARLVDRIREFVPSA